MSHHATHGTFEGIIAMATPDLKPVCLSLRGRIASLHNGFVEIVWPKLRIASFGVGPKKITQHYAYIAVQGSHINVGLYHGASLLDPAHMLEGAGKELRHVKIRDVAVVTSPALVILLRLAIDDRKPFAMKHNSPVE